MRVLVTGGAGFIGSTLVDRLAREGHAVTVVDDFSSGKRENLEGALGTGLVDVVEADIRDTRLAEIFSAQRPEIVLHLAAQIDVRVSVADPVLDAGVNILGTLNVLENAWKTGARKVVLASSGGCIYGDARVLPVRESFAGRPDSPYGIGKRVLSDYLAFYRRVHGLRSAVLALGNVCGPRQDPHGEAGVVAMFLGAMLAGKPTTIYGDGSQTRDFVYVDDVVDSFVRAMTRGRGLYNIGTGIETSVLDLWKQCATVSGYSLEPVQAPARAGELQRSALDASRAARDLEWTPRMSLAEAVRRTCEFIARRSGAR